MVFLDIFSKKKIVNKIKLVIVDNRETGSLVPSELKRLGFEIKFEQLEVADYIIGDVAIERKTVSDFVSSFINKRIFSQLEDLRKYSKYFLILEGNLKDLYSGGVHENACRGMILSVALDYGVPIVFTRNEKDTAKYIDVLSRKTTKSPLSLRASRTDLSDEERIQFILEGFSDIGPVASRKLVERFGSLKNIFSASLSELEEVLGKKAKEFFRLTNLH